MSAFKKESCYHYVLHCCHFESLFRSKTHCGGEVPDHIYLGGEREIVGYFLLDMRDDDAAAQAHASENVVETPMLDA
jgi:hypothetical protein